MRTLAKLAIIFTALTILSSLLMQYTSVEFGRIDFFENHGYFFLVAIALFPRLTLLISSVPFGGIGWWLGFFFAPHLLVAVLATIHYWHTNPVLVVIAWLVAWGGEVGEKYVLTRKVKQRQNFNQYQKETIEAEYEIKS